MVAVALEDLGGADGQRRIEEDLHRRDLALVDQGAEVEQDLLGALDGEGRDQDVAAGLAGGVDLGLERAAPGFGRQVGAVAIAIGTLAEQVVDFGRAVGIVLQGLAVGADVAGEQHPLAAVAALPFPVRRGNSNSMEAEPRMWPAFQQRTRMPWPASNQVSIGKTSISSAVRRPSSLE